MFIRIIFTIHVVCQSLHFSDSIWNRSVNSMCVCVWVCYSCVLFMKYLKTDMCIILLMYRILTGEVVDIKFNQFKNESKFIVFMFVSTWHAVAAFIYFSCFLCCWNIIFYVTHIFMLYSFILFYDNESYFIQFNFFFFPSHK